MLTLVNTNRMRPLVAPIGLDYVGAAVRGAGIEVALVDLALAEDPGAALAAHFAATSPRLVGVTIRNVDDCFWPSGAYFVPEIAATIDRLRTLTDAPIVVGGVGYSIFAEAVLERTGADFGVRGDGEGALVALYRHLDGGRRRLDRVPGLLWHADGGVRANDPAYPNPPRVPTDRNLVDHAAYFRLGGQGAVETKRGCPRTCAYCADFLAKGRAARLRPPEDVAEEMACLASRGIDVLHLADAEFNVPIAHARAVCDALIDRGLGERVRWYAYLATVPFDEDLAERMRRAGCVGMNFTGDSAAPAMLRAYGQPHAPADLAENVRLGRENGLAVMIDLLLGGPGETPETVGETIRFLKAVGPDAVGAPLGLRLYPGTAMAARVAAEGSLETNPGLCRHYDGPVDLTRPTFYIAPALGPRPARLVNDLIGGDPRFFAPMDESPYAAATDHNYNANAALERAIAAGARGAYWHILRGGGR